MRPARPAFLALALAGGGWCAPPAGQLPIQGIEFLGASPDDRLFAGAALGLAVGDAPDPAALALALGSVRATDRFRGVEAGWLDRPEGRVLQVRLDPWPEIQGWDWRGDPLPKRLQAALAPGLERGLRPGAIRLEALRLRAEQRLRDAGFPQGRVTMARNADGSRILAELHLGPEARIERVDWDGEPLPYGREQALRIAGIRPGLTAWTPSLRREAIARLRKRFLADRHYEWQADLSWNEGGLLKIRINPGPIVRVEFEGDRVRWTGTRDLLPLVWADRFSPDLLDEGDRRLLRYLNGEGFMEAQVTHRREILRGSASDPQEVRVVYSVRRGTKGQVASLRFERNRELSSEELARAARLPGGSWFSPGPELTPELIEGLEDRVRAHYLRQGFSEVSLRRRIENDGGRKVLVLSVREGPRRELEGLTLQLPGRAPWDPWDLAEVLPSLLGEKVRRVPDPRPGFRTYRSERSDGGAVEAQLNLLPGAPGEDRKLRLAFSRPIPLVKSELAQLLVVLRQRVARLGTPRPLVPRLLWEEGVRGERVVVEIPDQPLFQVRRLVVQGSDETRAEAVLREIALGPGTPLDPMRLNQGQARIGNLGAFDRADLLPLAEAPHPEPRPAWKEGDMLLRVQERPHWVVSSSFGYDRNSGYHIGTGVQRLNFQGLGRVLDFNARAGDATLQNGDLRKIFSTGPFRRSVDIYSIGYSDPWFAPGKIAPWLPERTEYRAEAAYLDELQSSFEIRRRRVLNGLVWRPLLGTEVRLGHRFERVEVSSFKEGLSDDQLNALTKTPGRVIISAPYFQYIRDRRSRDGRDNPYDPTEGTYFFGKLELANQFFGTSKNASFVKLDLRHQWNWPLGFRAEHGVVSLGARIGIARPTASSSEELPLSERFFAGGPGTHRGVEPDFLGPVIYVPLIDPNTGQIVIKDGSQQFVMVASGGQALAILNLEYRFPISPSVWGEVFLDTGQVYKSLRPERNPAASGYDLYFESHPYHAPFRTALGLGLIFKLGIPIKIEYAMDARRIFGAAKWKNYQVPYLDPITNTWKTRVVDFQIKDDHDTQLRTLLISAGFQF
ncbi:MAG: BamA/TamA family outer membrane protein [Acidobacteria bacterium]|nr:BamA/TamA family outer membrane protein [Acidobacteriota bacterium]